MRLERLRLPVEWTSRILRPVVLESTIPEYIGTWQSFFSGGNNDNKQIYSTYISWGKSRNDGTYTSTKGEALFNATWGGNSCSQSWGRLLYGLKLKLISLCNSLLYSLKINLQYHLGRKRHTRVSIINHSETSSLFTCVFKPAGVSKERCSCVVRFIRELKRRQKCHQITANLNFSDKCRQESLCQTKCFTESQQD